MCLFSLHILECSYFLSHYNCNLLPVQILPRPPPGQQWWFLTSCHLIITSCPISVFPFIIQVFLPSFLTVRWAFYVLAHVIQIFILHLHFFISWVVISHYSTFNFMLIFFTSTHFLLMSSYFWDMIFLVLEWECCWIFCNYCYIGSR